MNLYLFSINGKWRRTFRSVGLKTRICKPVQPYQDCDPVPLSPSAPIRSLRPETQSTRLQFDVGASSGSYAFE